MKAPVCILLAWVVIALGSVTDAHAQAWVGYKGSLDLGLDYNFASADRVVGNSDLEFPGTGIRTHQISVGAEYVPVERLAVNAVLPLAFLKITGDKDLYPHAMGGSYDDGDTHITLTDLRVGARYQVLEEPFALSPHLGVSIPVADYETVGVVVGGRHLKALHMGLGMGRLIGEYLYVDLLYEFSLVEKYDRTPDTEKYGQNRSDLAFTFGGRLLEGRLDLSIGANLRLTHGGLNFSDGSMWTADEASFHDAILNEDIFLLGVGAGYQVTDTIAVGLSGRFFVKGYNTQNANVLGLGVSWSVL